MFGKMFGWNYWLVNFGISFLVAILASILHIQSPRLFSFTLGTMSGGLQIYFGWWE